MSELTLIIPLSSFVNPPSAEILILCLGQGQTSRSRQNKISYDFLLTTSSHLKITKMRPQSRPNSMMDRRPSQESLLSTRAHSIARDSSTSLPRDPKNKSEQTLVDDIELLVSARQSPEDYPPVNLDFSQPATQAQGNRPYSTALGWNSSSVTLRASPSATSLKDKGFTHESDQDLGAVYGGTWREEGDTRAIRIRYALMVSYLSGRSSVYPPTLTGSTHLPTHR